MSELRIDPELDSTYAENFKKNTNLREFSP
jgi:hypothetical protein